MRARFFGKDRKLLQHRLVRQASSLVLSYPDDRLSERLSVVDSLLGHVTGEPRRMLVGTVEALRGMDFYTAQTDYVATFDLNRGTTLYLTYWTAGDTRNRGSAMHTFVQAYGRAGRCSPGSEAPDHLAVALEFAATVDPVAGQQLLSEHRVALDILHGALIERGSLYAPTIGAVCATLPPVTDQELRRARRLAETGPAAEAIGLQPFTLTVPPRRQATPGAARAEGVR
ncbi:nitrate reductase molybdenum cofactor assembly chaperone [Nocardia ignorata]|uniref:nitrate reductase molybdenum cofactor assembly chaperone n=1 Tax=Nocardia ignorata TaxID=145285 RepID=UPI003625584A